MSIEMIIVLAIGYTAGVGFSLAADMFARGGK